MKSHIVICHPTPVNATRRNPSQTDLELALVLVIYT